MKKEMSDVEKSSISKLNNFFCGLHVLVHIAEAASSCLFEAEKLFFILIYQFMTVHLENLVNQVV